MRFKDLKIFQKNINLNKQTPALFLDRDGVLIKDNHYISDPKRVKLELGVMDLLRFAKKKGWITIVITNQSGIGRGYFNWADYDDVTKKMLSEISESDLIAAIFANSFVNSDSENSWRKPGTGMIMESLKYFNINLQKSTLIGDRITDLQSGVNAGISNLVHLLTGHGMSERERVLKYMKNDFFYFKDKKSNIKLFDNLDELLASKSL